MRTSSPRCFFLLLWSTEDQRKGLADAHWSRPRTERGRRPDSRRLVAGRCRQLSARRGPDRHADAYRSARRYRGPKEGAASIHRIQQRVDDAIADKKRLERLMRQVRMIDTTGIRIDLVDDADFSMFSLGTTVLTTDARNCST